MAILIDTSVDVTPNVPTFATGPEGSILIKAYAYPPYFTLQDAEEVNTLEVDFYAVEALGIDPFQAALNQIENEAWNQGQQVLAYFVYQKPIVELSVPEQFCVGDLCITPPFAGQTVVSGYEYRIWLLTRDVVYGPFPSAVRPFIPVALAVVIIAGILLIIPQIVGMVGILTGKVSWGELKNPQFSPLERVLDKPGDNIVRAEAGLAIPLLFLGAGMGGLAYLLTRLNSQSISVSQPTPGGGRVTVAGSGKR